MENIKIKDRFGVANIFNKEECLDCWAKLYCSRGCHANSYYSNRGILKPDETVCEMQKKPIECAIMIEACRMLDKIVRSRLAFVKI
ncbi:SPASM domain-containing protein [Pseudobacteroides cellulosolvens]|uniref:SPASM domain-containing protein n=1 Tax=Pseudobacteroides cellulosolvens TaxID=35825 RepID=UPI00191C004C